VLFIDLYLHLEFDLVLILNESLLHFFNRLSMTFFLLLFLYLALIYLLPSFLTRTAFSQCLLLVVLYLLGHLENLHGATRIYAELFAFPTRIG